MFSDIVHRAAIDYRLRVLPNGLKIYSVVDRSTTNVAVQIWYGVGAKNDPPGRSGFAHLVEHLMFKGTRDTPPEFIDRLTEDVGGENNASTDEDYTEYDEVAPSSQLQRLLWAEADRMGGLVVAHADFVAERRVVEQELREQLAADPYERLLELEAPRASYALSSNSRPVLGSVPDLEATTLDEVKDFHSLYYRPDNATLIVVGNFDPAQLDAWVDSYFGRLVRPEAPVPTVAGREPARLAHRRTDVYAPRVPQPAVVLTYAGPDATSPDAAALKVLDAVLTLGRSSRLRTSLVAQRGVADQVLSDVDLRRQTGLVEFGIVMADGVKLASGETALRREVSELRRRQISQAELIRAKNQLLVESLLDRETIDRIANTLGEAVMVGGDAAQINRDLAALQSVTAADVQRVARAYLVDARRVTIRYRAERRSASRRSGDPDPGAVPAPSGAGAPAAMQAAGQAGGVLPPAGPQAAPIKPAVFERTLANGLRVVVARTGKLPIATAALTIRGGSALDPTRKPGLADLTGALAISGAGGRLVNELPSSIEALGGALTSGTDYDSTTFTLSGLSPALPRGLAVLSHLVRQAGIGQARLRAIQLQLSDEFRASMGDAESICDLATAPLVFAGGPYGRPPSGYPGSLARITRRDVIREQVRFYRPDNATLVLTGDIDPATAFALAQRAFQGWRAPSEPRPGLPSSDPAPAAGRVVAVDLPGTDEATVMLVGRSVGRLNPSFGATQLASGLIGGGYSSRLNAEIRVRRGLTYDAQSEVEGFFGGGIFTATVQAQNARAAEVAGLMLDQVSGLALGSPTNDELAARKAELVGEQARRIETSADMADLLTDAALYGIDLGEVGRFPARIAVITPAQVQAAAAAFSDPSRIDVLVVGDARQFLPALKARFRRVELIHAKSLGAESVVLRRLASRQSAPWRQIDRAGLRHSDRGRGPGSGRPTDQSRWWVGGWLAG
jgi:zinc protease